MINIEYDRKKVYEYAQKWAYKRNQKYYNFDPVGGDCTSFASQCIYAGINTMNYAKNKGWYYINGNSKSPSWSGVEYLYQFLVNNQSIGPSGKEVKKQEIEIGDLAQLSFDGIDYTHTLVIVKIIGNELYSASHTQDTFNKQVSSYNFMKIRYIHIQGGRKWTK